MSMSSRKRAGRSKSRRYGRKRFRAAERALVRGDRSRSEHFSEAWGGSYMKGRHLPDGER